MATFSRILIPPALVRIWLYINRAAHAVVQLCVQLPRGGGRTGFIPGRHRDERAVWRSEDKVRAANKYRVNLVRFTQHFRLMSPFVRVR